MSASLDLEERELMKKRMRIYILTRNARVGGCREVNSKKEEGQRLRNASHIGLGLGQRQS